MSENPNPTITIVESCDPSSLAGGKAERKIHKEKYKSQQENCRKEEGGDFPQEPHSFPWPLKMDEKKIQKDLHLLQDTPSSVAHQCWIVLHWKINILLNPRRRCRRHCLQYKKNS